MIPNALASTGPYADLWGYLKSIEHALARSMSAIDLTDLDQDRLEALISLLEDTLSPEDHDLLSDQNFLDIIDSWHSDYSSGLDLRSVVESNERFKLWRRSSKKSFEEDIQRLISIIRRHLDGANKGLFQAPPPSKEFEVLHSIVTSLLLDVELTLQV